MRNRVSQYLSKAEESVNFRPAVADDALLAIVWRDGKPEVYALRNKQALDELIQHVGKPDAQGTFAMTLRFPDVASVEL